MLTFVKAENSAFVLNLPQLTGTDFAATSPVNLGSSGFLARAEFTTVTDGTGREFSIGIASVTLSESATSTDVLTTTNRIAFNATNAPTPDFDGDGMVGFSDFLAFAGQYGTRQGQTIKCNTNSVRSLQGNMERGKDKRSNAIRTASVVCRAIWNAARGWQIPS